MLIENMVKHINTLLAGERVRAQDIYVHLDRVIDDINTTLFAKFPTITEAMELEGYDGSYNFFPDIYIRKVVEIGAAYYFYSTDEEGNNTASAYSSDYQRGLYEMLRDYMVLVPEEYRNDEGGYANMEWDLGTGGFGIDLPNRGNGYGC